LGGARKYLDFGDKLAVCDQSLQERVSRKSGLVLQLDDNIGEEVLQPNAVWLGCFACGRPLPQLPTRNEISQDDFQYLLPLIIVGEEIGRAGDKVESTVQRCEVWCK